MKKPFTLSFVIAWISIAAMAQWSADPATNTFVSGTQKDMLFPKIALTPQGTYYLSCWKTLLGDNFHFWLQLLDENGIPQWGTDGIQISDQLCDTWLSDYSLVSDASGNAVMAFDDYRGGTGFSHVVAYMTAPDGHAVWDTNGVEIFTDTLNSFSPILVELNSGNFVVAWEIFINPDTLHHFTLIEMQKISPTGALLWPQPIMITETDSTAHFPVLTPVGDDDFVVCYQRRIWSEIPIPGSPWDTWIYAQRFNAEGQPVWPEKAKICEFQGDTIECLPEWFMLYPLKDENDGIYVSWFDDRDRTNYWNIYVQHIDSSGNLRWPLNGLAVSPVNFGHDRVEPQMAYDPVTQDVYVIWDEDCPSGGFSQFGMVGQRIGLDGTLKWGDLGIVLLDYTMDTSWYVNSVKMTPSRDIIIFADREYIMIDPPDTNHYDQLFAMKIDSNGNSVWAPKRDILAATAGTKFYPATTGLSNSMYVVSWGENREEQFSAVGSVYAQNVKLDGSLGPLGIPDLRGDNNRDVAICPNPSHGNTSVVFKEFQGHPVEVTLFTSSGNRILSFTQTPDPGSNSLLMDASVLSPGIYFLRITTEDLTASLRWIVL